MCIKKCVCVCVCVCMCVCVYVCMCVCVYVCVAYDYYNDIISHIFSISASVFTFRLIPSTSASPNEDYSTFSNFQCRSPSIVPVSASAPRHSLPPSGRNKFHHCLICQLRVLMYVSLFVLLATQEEGIVLYYC